MSRQDLAGISKISVQTGTSHGGVILPDGTIADVAVDFETLRQLSEVARIDYGLGGAVQHGASTLPEVAFGRFAEASAVEVHLATAFQNLIFEHTAFPSDLKDEIYAYLSANHADERKAGQTDAQFFYGARKRAFGPFKRQLWDLPVETRDRIAGDLEASFSLLMQRLQVGGQRGARSTASCPALTSPRQCHPPSPRPWPARPSTPAPRRRRRWRRWRGSDGFRLSAKPCKSPGDSARVT